MGLMTCENHGDVYKPGVFSRSAQDWRIWLDRISAFDEGQQVAVVTDECSPCLQELQAGLYPLHA